MNGGVLYMAAVCSSNESLYRELVRDARCDDQRLFCLLSLADCVAWQGVCNRSNQIVLL